MATVNIEAAAAEAKAEILRRQLAQQQKDMQVLQQQLQHQRQQQYQRVERERQEKQRMQAQVKVASMTPAPTTVVSKSAAARPSSLSTIDTTTVRAPLTSTTTPSTAAPTSTTATPTTTTTNPTAVTTTSVTTAPTNTPAATAAATTSAPSLVVHQISSYVPPTLNLLYPNMHEIVTESHFQCRVQIAGTIERRTRVCLQLTGPLTQTFCTSPMTPSEATTKDGSITSRILPFELEGLTEGTYTLNTLLIGPRKKLAKQVVKFQVRLS